MAYSKEGIFISQQKNVLDILKEARKLDILVDRRTTSRYCTFLGGNLMTWKSKKKNVAARSSAESEFISMALGICELLWLKIVLGDLKIN